MKGYNQFCPVSKASEIFAERWTPLVLRELFCGSSRFRDLRRGLPAMSPSLLSKRLKELEAEGIVERVEREGNQVEYRLTQAGLELTPVIEMLGHWGHRWARSKFGKDDLDPAFLMWDMRRELLPERFPDGRTVVSFEFFDAPPKKQRYWLVVDRQSVDLCLKPPPHEVDVAVEVGVRTMSEVYLGYQDMSEALAAGDLRVEGPRELTATVDQWLITHPVARGVRPRNRPAGIAERPASAAG